MRREVLRKIALGILVTFLCFSVSGQDLNHSFLKNSFGFRFGGTSGISYKYRYAETKAWEFIAGRTNYSYGVTVLFQHYIPTTARGLSVFIGGGGHAGKPFRGNYLISDDGYRLSYANSYTNSNSILGVDGIVGMEFLFKELPLSVSAEIKPYSEFFRYTGSSLIRLDPGVGLRYNF